jgi:drug/metabolite transporter (DMT)-like permease
MKKNKGLLALLVVCVLWGTTYFAIRVGVKTFPPLLFSGIRQIIASIFLILIVWLTGNTFDWTLKNILKQSILGFLLISMGNGLIGCAEVYVPSGLVALIASLVPLNIVLINALSGKGTVINAKIITGLLLGLAGMVFIFQDNLKDLSTKEYYTGIILTITATMCWSLGTVFSKKFNILNNTPFHNTALQFLAGGIIITIGGFLIEDKKEILTASSSSWLAMLYLIFFGSIIGFICYQYAIKTLPINTVALYAYINPLIAIILGCTFLKEKFTSSIAIAFILTITGVYLVNSGNKPKLR